MNVNWPMTSVHKTKETGNFGSNFLHIASSAVHVYYIEETSSVDVVFIIYFKKLEQESSYFFIKVLEIWNFIFEICI